MIALTQSSSDSNLQSSSDCSNSTRRFSNSTDHSSPWQHSFSPEVQPFVASHGQLFVSTGAQQLASFGSQHYAPQFGQQSPAPATLQFAPQYYFIPGAEQFWPQLTQQLPAPTYYPFMPPGGVPFPVSVDQPLQAPAPESLQYRPWQPPPPSVGQQLQYRPRLLLPSPVGQQVHLRPRQPLPSPVGQQVHLRPRQPLPSPVGQQLQARAAVNPAQQQPAQKRIKVEEKDAAASASNSALMYVDFNTPTLTEGKKLLMRLNEAVAPEISRGSSYSMYLKDVLNDSRPIKLTSLMREILTHCECTKEENPQLRKAKCGSLLEHMVFICLVASELEHLWATTCYWAHDESIDNSMLTSVYIHPEFYKRSIDINANPKLKILPGTVTIFNYCYIYSM